jgi:cytochrome c6
LKAANAGGKIGPDLDAAFGGARQQGLKESTIREVVAEQIKYPGQYATGGKYELTQNMPPNLVTGDDVDAVAVFVAAYAGTGKTPPGSATAKNSTKGKDIFKTNCASCHTLADAGATGTIGPNLDRLKPDLARVKKQVINGGKVMPAFKGKLTDKQIAAVAKYVSSVAGN